MGCHAAGTCIDGRGEETQGALNMPEQLQAGAATGPARIMHHLQARIDGDGQALQSGARAQVDILKVEAIVRVKAL